MSGDGAGDHAVSARVSAATARWLDDRAAELDLSREELLRGLLAAARATEADGQVADAGDVDALREDLVALDREVDELVADVRDRVVQVKRETDAKAAADHDHPELRESLDGVAARLDAIEETVEALREALSEASEERAALSADLDAGFENYEEVLGYLTDETDDLGERVRRLAGTVSETRARVEALSNRVDGSTAVEDLRDAANRGGVRVAVCGDCGGEVDVALLARPECPHCAAAFVDLEPRRGFLGSHTLVVGDPPALEAGRERGDPEPRRDGPDLPGVVDDA